MVENRYTMVGKSQHWHYNGGCAYECAYHKGKVEWHHPISSRIDVGLNLCEAHHSLLKGRKKKYLAECQIDKGISEMRHEVNLLVVDVVRAAGLDPRDIDKG